jgi:hypothetical protein
MVEVKKKLPGEKREMAQGVVESQREKGEKVRLIKTNERKELYWPYEAESPKRVGETQKISEKRSPVPENKVEIPEKREKAKTLGKNVHVHITASGEPRKGGVYIAKITGVDEKYGVKREFISTDTYSHKNDREVVYDGKLPAGTIVETGDGGSWKNIDRNWGIVESNGRIKWKGATSIESKKEMRRIIRMREKKKIANEAAAKKTNTEEVKIEAKKIPEAMEKKSSGKCGIGFHWVEGHWRRNSTTNKWEYVKGHCSEDPK